MKALILSLFALFLFVSALVQEKKLVIYWGQDGGGAEKELSHFCEDSTYDILILSFLDTFFDRFSKHGHVSLPDINFADHCSDTFPDFPSLLSCPKIAKNISFCQSQGKMVLLSLGGASGSYGFLNDSQAKQFASTIWDMFLGGINSKYPRPFGSVVLDGVDLDIEGGTTTGYSAFVNKLREFFRKDSSRSYYISAAPQCPFPDAFLGPGHGTAFNNSHFDSVNVQFYNNYCGAEFPDQFNFKQWSKWGSSAGTKIFLGVPASPQAASSGYVPFQVLQGLIDSIHEDPQWGGVMMWDAGNAEKNKGACSDGNYAQCVAKYIHG